MLREIREKIRPSVEETFNEMAMERIDSSSGVVMTPSVIMIMVCAVTVTKAPSLLSVKRSLQVDMEPLRMAAEVIEGLGEGGGIWN
jgi:hypothetical protein